MSREIKLGSRVSFNIGKEDGPVSSGIVTKVLPGGAFVINPDRPGLIPFGVRFHNIEATEEKVSTPNGLPRRIV